MIPIMPDEEFQKEEQNAQWDRQLESMTEDVSIRSVHWKEPAIVQRDPPKARL